MEVVASGAQVGARQPHEGEAGSVRASAHRDDFRPHSHGFHGPAGMFHQVHVRKYLFLHVVIGIRNFRLYRPLPVFTVQQGRAFLHEFLLALKGLPVMIPDEVLRSRLFHISPE